MQKTDDAEIRRQLIKVAALQRFPFWVANGRGYGYPKCCIFAYCTKHVLGLDWTGEQQMIIDDKKTFAGFIPCPAHAKQIQAKKIKIEDLITCRDEELQPYPNG